MSNYIGRDKSFTKELNGTEELAKVLVGKIPRQMATREDSGFYKDEVIKLLCSSEVCRLALFAYDDQYPDKDKMNEVYEKDMKDLAKKIKEYAHIPKIERKDSICH